MICWIVGYGAASLEDEVSLPCDARLTCVRRTFAPLQAARRIAAAFSHDRPSGPRGAAAPVLYKLAAIGPLLPAL